MDSSRLEAFTDGVIAIVITIMVLEIHVPKGRDAAALREEVPLFLAYVLSYINVGIFWNNHHHMLHATERIDGRVLWANLGLLFPLTLVPFVIRWIDEAGLTTAPVAAYGIVLTGAALGYLILERTIIAVNGPDSLLAVAVGSERKGHVSLALYVLAVPLAFFEPWVSIALYIAVALMWLVPDRRIESQVKR